MERFYWITRSDSKVCTFCHNHYLQDFKSRNYCKALRRIRHTKGIHEETCRCWPSLVEVEPQESPYTAVDRYLTREGFPRLSNEECRKVFEDFSTPLPTPQPTPAPPTPTPTLYAGVNTTLSPLSFFDDLEWSDSETQDAIVDHDRPDAIPENRVIPPTEYEVFLPGDFRLTGEWVWENNNLVFRLSWGSHFPYQYNIWRQTRSDEFEDDEFEWRPAVGESQIYHLVSSYQLLNSYQWSFIMSNWYSTQGPQIFKFAFPVISRTFDVGDALTGDVFYISTTPLWHYESDTIRSGRLQ